MTLFLHRKLNCTSGAWKYRNSKVQSFCTFISVQQIRYKSAPVMLSGSPLTRVRRMEVTWGIRKYRSWRNSAAHQLACLCGLVIAKWLSDSRTDHPSPLFRTVRILITIARRIEGCPSQSQPNTYLPRALALKNCAWASCFWTSRAHNQDHTFPSSITPSCPSQAHPWCCGSVSPQWYFY